MPSQPTTDIRPLADMRVLDLTHVLAGPFCTYQLALLGADTIKIEHPDEPDIVRESGSLPADNAAGMGTSFLTQNANKKCMTLDLKTEEGRDILRDLVKGADIFVQNYRVGALASLGLGYEDLKKINPKLIYCSMTGFGQSGPYAERNGYDQVIQAISGLMSTTGTPETGPLRAGPPVIDYAAGMSAALAILAAVIVLKNTGQGQHVDCSMLDTALMLSASLITAHLAGGTAPGLRGNDIDQAGVSGYRCKDGSVIMLGAWTRRQHRRFWTAMGRPDLAEYDTLALQGEHRLLLKEEFTKLAQSRTAAELEMLCNSFGVPAGRARSLPEALSLEQLKHRNMLHRFDRIPGASDGITVPVSAYMLEIGSPRIDTPPHTHGADTDDILLSLGIEASKIADLRTAKVI